MPCRGGGGAIGVVNVMPFCKCYGIGNMLVGQWCCSIWLLWAGECILRSCRLGGLRWLLARCQGNGESGHFDSWGGIRPPRPPPIKSAWRPPNMDMYSGCYIHNMDIYIYTYIFRSIYIYPYYGYNIQNTYPDFGNSGTNVANGSVRMLTVW
jgi:hypothetical protein